MLRVTRWNPDTCGCVLEYEWDDTQDENTRTHSFKKAISLCEYHKALLGTNAYVEVMSENTRKNEVWGEVQNLYPSVTLEDYTWSFDATRKLKVGFLGKLKVEEKSTLQTVCDSKFGIGKVEVI